MAFTDRPGNTSAQPANFVPGLGVSIHRYSQSFSASITPSGTLTIKYNNVFNQISITVFRAVSRARNFITQPRPLL